MKKKIENLADVVYSTRNYNPSTLEPEGVLVYLKTTEGNDAIAYIDKNGNSVTQSQFAILRKTYYEPNTPAIPRYPQHL